MKKNYIIFGITVAIVLGILVGVLISNSNKNNKLVNVENDENKEKIANIKNNEITDESKVITTGAKEEKTTPHTTFIFKTYYKECKHTTNKKQDIPKEYVNLTKKEIEEKYKGWEVQNFESGEVIFFRKLNGICDEHYILKDNNGYLAIYVLNSEGEEILKKVTEIVTLYLPEIDKVQLKEGIKIIGKENLNSALEDYE